MSYFHINLRKLHHIQTIAALGSYVRAADALAITQSALTRSIQSVEEHFGVRIFDRDRSGVQLTAIGRILLDRAAPLLRDARDIEKELFRMGSGEEGDVAIGMSPIVAKAALTDLLNGQLRDRPAARTRAYVRASDPLLALLRSEQIEFCATTFGSIEATGDLTIRPIAKISNMLAVAAGHPLLAKPDLAFEDIRDFPLVSSTYPTALERYFADRGHRHGPSVVTEDYGALLDLTLNRQAVWLTSPIGCGHEIERGDIKRLPVEPVGVLSAVDVAIISLSRRTLSPLAQTLIRETERLIQNAVAGSPDLVDKPAAYKVSPG